jgi:two-component system, NtrC family, nitrogen regulation response regulator GlnG
MKSIWIADDDQSIRFVLERALAREGFTVRSFSNARDVLAAIEIEQPQVLVSDIRMPGGSGIDLLAQVKSKHPGLPVIIMTAYSDLDHAVSAFQRGAFEYLAKPFDVPKATELVRRAVEESLREPTQSERSTQVPEMLGQASAMQDVFRAIGRLSQSIVTVLITGESGSGKELVAKALHKHSPRGEAGSNGPFVAINTAAIPKDLLESEFFGHERGTLLRVLSDGQFYRVGGHSPMRSNVRIIAATHQDLEERVRAGAFREDLFHRLNVIRLRLPALRERQEDIPVLAKFFLQRSAKDLGVDTKQFSEAALARLLQFDYPGNVRQLENICRWLSVMAPSKRVDVDDLPPELKRTSATAATSTPPAPAFSAPNGEVQAVDEPGRPATQAGAPVVHAASSGAAAVHWLVGLEEEARALLLSGMPNAWEQLTQKFEARLIQTALEITHGKRIEAAQRLGIGRNTITRKIQELGLKA